MLNDKITKELRLSDVLELEDFRIDRLNIVHAPTRSGKTYAAINTLNQFRGEKRLLYLIVTTAGKENIHIQKSKNITTELF